jgi:polar amino acid transport system substrate-binding protein
VLGEVCHFVDSLTYLCGSLPIDIQAVAARGHADAVSILLRFADGSTGTIVYSSIGEAGVPKEYLEAFGAGVVARLDDFTRLTINKAGKTVVSKGAQNKGQGELVRAFLGAARSGGEPPIPLAEIEAVTGATLAIEETLRAG